MGLHIQLRKTTGKTVMQSRTTLFESFPHPADRTGSAVPQALLDDLFTVAYEELRRIARAISWNEPGMTLSPTALVNEAWIKLAKSPPATVVSPLHFRSIAARAMRQVLVETARRREATRRGSDLVFVTLDDGATPVSAAARDILALDDALDELSRLNSRQARMIEARFFGGLDTTEIAELLGISEATVLRDWRAARAWLAREIRAW